jgi:hypothetical protein
LNRALTEKEVLWARELHASGRWSFNALAVLLGVSPGKVVSAVEGLTWGHLPFFLPVVCMCCREMIGVKGGFVQAQGETTGLCLPCSETQENEWTGRQERRATQR